LKREAFKKLFPAGYSTCLWLGMRWTKLFPGWNQQSRYISLTFLMVLAANGY
jgi:hypothetical protein